MLLAALVLCTEVTAPGQPTSVPAPKPLASQPAQPETAGAACARLARLRANEISDEGIVLRVALELALALGQTDGQRAAGLLDATGYQALPLAGNLPEDPGKPISREDFRTKVQGGKTASFDSLPMTAFEVVRQKTLKASFPAVAEWMLREDWAVIFNPVAGRLDWVPQRCCVVIRLRARRPAILGGNILEVLGRG